jgi:hypothetical protein
MDDNTIQIAQNVLAMADCLGQSGEVGVLLKAF